MPSRAASQEHKNAALKKHKNSCTYQYSKRDGQDVPEPTDASTLTSRVHLWSPRSHAGQNYSTIDFSHFLLHPAVE
jgi:hypothetical protein